MFEPRSERWTESLVRKMPQAEGIACVEAWNRGVSFGMWRWCWKLGLCALVVNWILERVLGEAEKSSFIAMPGKGEYSWLLPLKIVCPNAGGFGEELYSNTSRVWIQKRLGCVQGLLSFNLVSVFFFFFRPHSLRDPSSLIRDWTYAPCSGNTAS